jgi:hypothetical protein
MNIPSMIRKPSAFLPVAMSLVALTVVLAHVLVSGTARETDEGSAAHVFQLLMAAQVPFVVFFAIKSLPQNPRPALMILALQVGAALAALAPVLLFNL